MIKAADPLVNDDWMAKIKLWKYKPYSVNGRAVPFCHPARIEVRLATTARRAGKVSVFD